MTRITTIALALLLFWSPDTRADTRSEASDVCMRTVRKSAQYPSKAEFYPPEFVRTEEQGWSVIGRVDFMNGFGAMIPHWFVCDTSSDGKTVLTHLVWPEGR